MKNKLKLIKTTLDKLNLTWNSNNGSYKLYQLEDSHLENIIALLWRQIESRKVLLLNDLIINDKPAQTWFNYLRLELARRQLSKSMEEKKMNKLDKLVDKLLSKI